MRATPLILLVCTAVLSCGPAPAWIDGETLMFDPDWIVEVNIEVDPDDWDEMRYQTRSFEDVLCATAPPKNPFTYFKGDITIDGIKVKSVGIRKKCFFGSCDQIRPSFKVSFNHYVRGQKFFGMRRMTLNNSKSDPSKIKQCLGYWLFNRGGVPSPRCNFAHVTINGEEVEWVSPGLPLGPEPVVITMPGDVERALRTIGRRLDQAIQDE